MVPRPCGHGPKRWGPWPATRTGGRVVTRRTTLASKKQTVNRSEDLMVFRSVDGLLLARDGRVPDPTRGGEGVIPGGDKGGWDPDPTLRA